MHEIDKTTSSAGIDCDSFKAPYAVGGSVRNGGCEMGIVLNHVDEVLEAALTDRPRERVVSVARLMREVRSVLPGLEMSDEDLRRQIETTLVERGYNISFDGRSDWDALTRMALKTATQN